MIAIQGTADPLVPIGGGEVGGRLHLGAGGFTESAQNSVKSWALYDGCLPNPKESDFVAEFKDGTSVHQISYTDCKENSEVTQYIVNGMGHRWPSTNSLHVSQVVDWALGPTSKNIDATKTIWEFFEKHSPQRH